MFDTITHIRTNVQLLSEAYVGDYTRMCSDDAALQLALAAVNVEGLSTFEQAIVRAEAIKRERSRIYTPLNIDVVDENAHLTTGEMRELVRQFYGELQPGDMDAIEREWQGQRRELDRDYNRDYNRYMKQYRAKREQVAVSVAV